MQKVYGKMFFQLIFYFLIFTKSFFKADVLPFMTDVMLADVIAICLVVDVKPLRQMLIPLIYQMADVIAIFCGRCWTTM